MDKATLYFNKNTKYLCMRTINDNLQVINQWICINLKENKFLPENKSVRKQTLQKQHSFYRELQSQQDVAEALPESQAGLRLHRIIPMAA